MKKAVIIVLAVFSSIPGKTQQKVQDSLSDFDYVHIKEHLLEIKDNSERKNYLQTIQRNFIKRKYNLVHEKTQVSSAIATSSCGNLDFEDGNTAGWTLTGDFQIMSGSTTDPFGGFPTVCPGGNFSLRLNDNNTSCSGTNKKVNFKSSAIHNILVTPSNSLILVNFAAATLAFPHPQNASSFFKIEFFDQLSVPIPTPTFSACYASPPNSIVSTNPSTFSNSPAQGAQICSTVGNYPVIYFPWQTQVFNMSSYIGQTISIKLTANWCLYDYDWAYAYFDVCCDGTCPILNNPAYSSTTITNICDAGLFQTELCSSTPNNLNFQWSSSSTNTTGCESVVSMGSYTVTSNPLSNPSFTVKEIFNFYPNPKVSFNLPIGNACSNSSTSIALIGSPPGGTFSGPGTTTSSFDPWLVANGTYTITYTYTDSISGCSASATQTIVVTTCTGIQQQNKEIDLIVAPNPFSSEIFIRSKDLPENSEIILFNTLGQEILRKRLTEGKNIIETSGFPPGLYIYSLFSKGKQVRQGKLVKE